jgi:hypothetical protein
MNILLPDELMIKEVEFRIKIQLKENLRFIFMCYTYLYEEIYAPIYKEEETGSILPNE